MKINTPELLAHYKESGIELSDPVTIESLVKEQWAWSLYNFPGHFTIQPFKGLIEEVGELSHALLKREQKIRMEENHDAKIVDALGDIVVYLTDFLRCIDVNLVSLWKAAEIDFDVIGEIGGSEDNYLEIIESLGHIASMLRYRSQRKPRTAISQFIYALMNLAYNLDIDLMKAIDTTWKEVRLRDWRS